MPTPLDLLLLNSMARGGSGMSPELLARLAQMDPDAAAYLASIQQGVPVRQSPPTLPPLLPPVTPMQGAMTAANKLGPPLLDYAHRYYERSRPATMMPTAALPSLTAATGAIPQVGGGVLNPTTGQTTVPGEVVIPPDQGPGSLPGVSYGSSTALQAAHDFGANPPPAGAPPSGTGTNIGFGNTLGAAGGALAILQAAQGGGTDAQRALAMAGGAANLGANAASMAGSTAAAGAAPYVGQALALGSDIAGSGDTRTKAVNSAIDAAALASIPIGGPIGPVVAPLAKAEAKRNMQFIDQGDWLKFVAMNNPGALPITLGLDIASMFGFDPFSSPPRQKVSLPGLTKTLDQTAGGAKTTYKSYNEGIGGAQAFGNAIQNALTVDDLVRAMNQQYSPFAGQFEILGQGPKGGIANVPLNVNYPNVGFTAADLMNPDVVNSLQVNAGVLGAPAPQDALRQALVDRIKFATRQSGGMTSPGTAGTTKTGGQAPASGLSPTFLAALAAGVA